MRRLHTALARAVVCGACIVSTLAACDDDSRQASGTRFSFGRGDAQGRGVRTPRDARVPRSPWVLAATIRDDSGSAHRLRSVVAADLLADGSVIVADAAQNSLYVYDSNGDFARTVESNGRAPRSNNSLQWVGVIAGDTLISFDQATRTFDIRAVSGAPIGRRHAPGVVDSSLLPSVASPDGVIAFARKQNLRNHGLNSRAAFVRDTGFIALASIHHDSVHTVGPFVIAEYLVDGAAGSAFTSAFPFQPQLFTAACNDGVFIAWSADEVVTFAGWSGEVYDSIAVPLPAVPMPPNAWRSALGRYDKQTPASARVASALGRVIPPMNLPRFSGLVAEGCDRLWVRPYTVGNDSTSIWIAYDRAGRLIDREELPGNAEIVRLRGRRALVFARDSVGNAELRLYDRQRRN